MTASVGSQEWFRNRATLPVSVASMMVQSVPAALKNWEYNGAMATRAQLAKCTDPSRWAAMGPCADEPVRADAENIVGCVRFGGAPALLGFLGKNSLADVGADHGASGQGFQCDDAPALGWAKVRDRYSDGDTGIHGPQLACGRAGTGVGAGLHDRVVGRVWPKVSPGMAARPAQEAARAGAGASRRR